MFLSDLNFLLEAIDIDIVIAQAVHFCKSHFSSPCKNRFSVCISDLKVKIIAPIGDLRVLPDFLASDFGLSEIRLRRTRLGLFGFVFLGRRAVSFS